VSRLLAVAAALTLNAAHSGLASVPTDTIRAGQCSSTAMATPDTSAAWFRVMEAWYHETPGAWSNDSLRTELLALEQRDQAVRRGITPDSMKDAGFMRRMRAADSANAARMRRILARYGWPGKSTVGALGAHAAFVLVQHAPELGPEAPTLTEAARSGEVSPADLALLTDRQRTSSGRPQLYGSQLDTLTSGVLPFFPIEDAAHVEERRAKAGLPPLRDYACMVATMYKAPVVLPDAVTH